VSANIPRRPKDIDLVDSALKSIKEFNDRLTNAERSIRFLKAIAAVQLAGMNAEAALTMRAELERLEETLKPSPDPEGIGETIDAIRHLLRKPPSEA
jgi:hypothetical protein